MSINFAPGTYHAGPPQAVAPLQRAIDLTKWMLFNPFDFKKWAILGLAVWLSNCGHGVGPMFQGLNNTGAPPLGAGLFGGKGITPGMINVGVFAISAIAWFGLLWINTHMDFVTLDNVSRGRAQLDAPWREFGSEANSLYLLRAGIYAVSLLISVPLILLIGTGMPAGLGLTNTSSPAFALQQIQQAFKPLLILLPVMLLLKVVQLFVATLVLPIMYTRRIGAMAAIGEALNLGSRNFGVALGYVGMQFVLEIAGITAAGIVTLPLMCLVCTLFIPGLVQYIAVVITLPVWVGQRAYAGAFIEQFGPQYQFFRRDEEYLTIAAQAPQTATAEQAYVPLPNMSPQSGSAPMPPMGPPPFPPSQFGPPSMPQPPAPPPVVMPPSPSSVRVAPPTVPPPLPSWMNAGPTTPPAPPPDSPDEGDEFRPENFPPPPKQG